MTMEGRISIDVYEGVADVKLIRGDKMNALDGKMFNAFVEAGAALSANPEVRAVVLSGEGKAFCAGLDVSNFAGIASSGAGEVGGGKKAPLAERTNGIANLPQYAAWVWRELPVPVIAAIHGVAFGGGFQLAMGADIRYASPDSRFSIMEIKWGLVPDMSGTQLLRHLVRDDVLRELSYTGRVFSAQEALDYGIVTRIVDDPAVEAMEIAREIASKNPDAIRADKRLFNEANYLSAADGLMMESREQDEIIGSANQIEAVMAQLEGRAANFS